jgi:hypothetical protein
MKFGVTGVLGVTESIIGVTVGVTWRNQCFYGLIFNNFEKK